MTNAVADLDTLSSTRIGPDDVGHSVFVTSVDAWYESMFEGQGLDKWRQRIQAGKLLEGAATLEATFGFAVFNAITDTTATVTLGTQLPAGALVLGCAATWTDWIAGASVITAEVGDGSTADRFADELTLSAVGSSNAMEIAVLASATSVVITITSDDEDLADLTAGTITVRLLYCIPLRTESEITVGEVS